MRACVCVRACVRACVCGRAGAGVRASVHVRACACVCVRACVYYPFRIVLIKRSVNRTLKHVYIPTGYYSTHVHLSSRVQYRLSRLFPYRTTTNGQTFSKWWLDNPVLPCGCVWSERDAFRKIAETVSIGKPTRVLIV